MAKIGNVIRKDFWFLLLIVGVVSLPLFTDYILTGTDLSASLSRIRVLGEYMGRVFPMRIIPFHSAEYGYSGASFQANLLYLFPALLYKAGIKIGIAYKCAILLCHFATAVIADICFLKISGRREVGLIGSMLFTWCPYRLSMAYLVGDLGGTAAWTFLPLIILGLKSLYGNYEFKRNSKGAFCLLTVGWSLTAQSSTLVFTVVSVMLFLFFLIMGKESFRRDRLLLIVKVVLAVAAINACFFVPLMFWMKEASNVAPILSSDFQGGGVFLLQYATFFEWGGTEKSFLQNGMKDAMAVGPGACVTLLLIFCLWALFVKKYQADENPEIRENWRLVRKFLWVGFLLMILSSNSFPWNLGKDRNLLFSVFFALLHTPSELGIAVDLCLICAACLFLMILADQTEKKFYNILLLMIISGGFCTTQFLLNNILFSHSFIWGEEIAEAASLPFELFGEQILLWRVSEAVSGTAIIFLLGRYVVRRFKNVP